MNQKSSDDTLSLEGIKQFLLCLAVTVDKFDQIDIRARDGSRISLREGLNLTVETRVQLLSGQLETNPKIDSLSLQDVKTLSWLIDTLNKIVDGVYGDNDA